jgi:hypothetical protein
MRVSPLSDLDAWQCKKLLEYGFFKRGGAIIDIWFSTGLLAHPSYFNYTNHPYPIYWLFALLQYISGPWAPVVFVLLVNLATSWLVFCLLRKDFDAKAALIATLLYVTAPECVFFSMSSNNIAFGAWFWPVAVLWIRRLRAMPAISWGQTVGLGLLVFIAGQATWFAFTLVPVLLLLSAEGKGPWRQFLERNFRNRLWWAILAGASLSLLLFALQIVVYTPSFTELWSYAFGQAGQGAQEVPPWRMITSMAIKTSVLVGPALMLGMAGAAVIWLIRRGAPSLVCASALYLVVFVAAVAVLVRFAFRERSPYAYLLFPSTCLTAWALQQVPRRLWRWSLLLAAAMGVAYIQMKASIPVWSKTSQKLGHVIAARTRPEDLVLTNLRLMRPPFPAWDIAGWEMARETADRLVFLGMDRQSAIGDVLRRFRGEPPPVVFVRAEGEPMDPALDKDLNTRGQIVDRLQFQPATETETWAETLRTYYWRLQGKPWVHRVAPDAAHSQAVTLEFIRITM